MNLTIPRIADTFTFTTRHTLQKELERTRDSYKSLLNNVSVGIIRTDVANQTIVKINQSALHLLEYTSLESIKDAPISKLYNNQKEYQKHLRHLRRKGNVKNLELKLQRSNGDTIVVLLSSIVHYEEGKARWIDTSIQDITDQNRIQEKMFKLAHYDALTGLANRYAFMQNLDASIENAARYNRQSALLFIDLDGFKQINDTYGHKSGDALLIEIASRFNKQVRRSDIVARMGGDEFTIFIPEYSGVHDIAGLAQKIVTAVSQPIELKNASVHVSASIGIALYPHDGTSSDLLLSNADNAMYYAKELGKNNYQFFSKELNIESVNRLIFEMELKQALKRKELYIDFQPRVNVNNRNIIAVEALCRWNNPDFGLVNPSEFIPVAEECKMIKELSFWMMEEAIYHLQLWHKIKGQEKLRLVINLSCENLDDDNFISALKHLLTKTQLNADFLEFDITERTLSKNSNHPTLYKLRELGCHINIDNYGSAASSLDIFNKLTPSCVKIDHTFIEEIHKTPSLQKVFLATQGIAKAFDFDVVAHGIRNEEELQWLQEHGCHIFQGYSIAAPLKLQEVSNFLITY